MKILSYPKNRKKKKLCKNWINLFERRIRGKKFRITCWRWPPSLCGYLRALVAPVADARKNALWNTWHLLLLETKKKNCIVFENRVSDLDPGPPLDPNCFFIFGKNRVRIRIQTSSRIRIPNKKKLFRSATDPHTRLSILLCIKVDRRLEWLAVHFC